MWRFSLLGIFLLWPLVGGLAQEEPGGPVGSPVEVAGESDLGGEFLLQRVLQRYTAAYGGLREADALESLSLSGTQYQGEESYAFTLRKRHPNSLRYRMEIGNTVLEAGYNGKVGWRRTRVGGSTEVERLEGPELEMLRWEADFEGPLFRFQQTAQTRLRLQGMARIGVVQTHVIEVEQPDGERYRYFLDTENSRVLRVVRLNADGGIAWETLYRDFREVEGYPIAFEVENRVDGETVSLSRLDEVEVNPGLLSFIFEMPGS